MNILLHHYVKLYEIYHIPPFWYALDYDLETMLALVLILDMFTRD